MWPKAFAQLIELAPHVSRLLPLADRVLKEKATADDATRRALDAHRQSFEQAHEVLRSDLRSELGQIGAQYTGLQKQVIDVEKHLSAARADAMAAKVATEATDARLARIEARQGQLTLLLVVTLVAVAAMLILLVLLYTRGR